LSGHSDEQGHSKRGTPSKTELQFTHQDENDDSKAVDSIKIKTTKHDELLGGVDIVSLLLVALMLPTPAFFRIFALEMTSGALTG
jgi:hypothetical protein